MMIYSAGTIHIFKPGLRCSSVLSILKLASNHSMRSQISSTFNQTITISSNLIGALTALFFTNHCVGL